MLVKSGATDVLITNNIAPQKASQLALLAKNNPKITFGVLVDSEQVVDAIQEAVGKIATQEKLEQQPKLRVLVEIECGMDRCGVAAGSDAMVSLVRSVLRAPNLNWGGLHVYAGNLGQVRSTAIRHAAVHADDGPISAARRSLARLERDGIKSLPCVTGGGTGTNMMDLHAGIFTELQAGSYLFMDGNYSNNEEGYTSFKQALYVQSTVISSDEKSGKRIIDAGTKAIDILYGKPQVTNLFDKELCSKLSNVNYTEGGCEHGILRNVPDGVLKVGDTVQLLPSDLYSTVNRHACFVGVRVGIRGKIVERIDEIDGRYPELQTRTKSCL